MAAVTAIVGEGIGECVEGIKMEVRRKMLRELLAYVEFWFDGDGVLAGFSLGCVDGDGARCLMLICGLIGVTEEIRALLLQRLCEIGPEKIKE